MVTVTVEAGGLSIPVVVSAIKGTSLAAASFASLAGVSASALSSLAGGLVSGSCAIPRSPRPLSRGVTPDGKVGFELEQPMPEKAIPMIAHAARNTNARFMCTPCRCECPYREDPLDLLPALGAGESASAGARTSEEALDALVVAADKGRDSTVDLVAKIGRASRLGERSRGVLDPGAVSCAIILRTLAEGAKSKLAGVP